MPLRRRSKRVSVQNAENSKYSGSQELADTENGLPGYSAEIVRKLIRYMGLHSVGADFQVLEFGAGTGFLAQIWKTETGVAPLCVEIDQSLIHAIEARGFVCISSVDDAPPNLDAIYTSNVLEHIEDDVSALKMLHDHLQPYGRIGIYVPALPVLFSDMDRTVGHFRRYKRRELIGKVEAAGFEVQTCFYDDFVGFFASLAIKTLGYKGKTGLGSANSLKFYDGWVYPISKFLDQIGMRRVIGKNLLLIAVKP